MATARSSKAIPIRRPGETSAPPSPKPKADSPKQQPAETSNTAEPVDVDASLANRISALNVAAAPVFVPKSQSRSQSQAGSPSSAAMRPPGQNQQQQPAASAVNLHAPVFNPNSRPFTPPTAAAPVPSTSQLQPTASDFTMSPATPMEAAAPEFMPNAFEPQTPVDMYSHYADASHDAQSSHPFFGPPGVARPEFSMQRPAVYYHLYQPPLPHISSHNPQQLALNSLFISPTLREDLQKRAEALAPVDGLDIPGYFSLVALDAPTQSQPNSAYDDGTQTQSGRGIFGVRNWVYKAVAEADGKPYIVRRLENHRLQNDHALGMIERWRRIRHPNIVNVREAFTTRAFGDASVVFVYDIHPLAQTLYDAYLSPAAQSAALRHPPRPGANPLQHFPERIFWSFAIQLSNAIKTVHDQKLAVRTVELSKILVTGQHRLRINGCGMLDVIRNDLGTEQALHQLQQEDLFDLGKVLLALTCSSPSAVHNLARSLEFVSKTYSPDVSRLLLFLFSPSSPTKNIDGSFAIIGSRILDELNGSLSQSDILESEMMREIENARLVRLLCKFGFINERPEFDHDPRWAESGDRYLIKLFRDHVFHQVDEHGRPVLDLSHVLTALNKLDAGVDDKVMLVSRDSQSCLLVSYREIKNCIEAAYRDLSR